MTSKYRAQKTEVDGITFDSKKEASRYAQLKQLEKAGVISNLEIRPSFKLSIGDRPILIRSEGYPNGRQARFTLDFAYWDGERKVRVLEDVKGGKITRTQAYVLRKAVLEAMYPAIRVEEV